VPTLAHRLVASLRRLEDVIESESGFRSGAGYWVNGTEIAHLDEGDVLDLRLTATLIRERRAELKADPRVTLRRSGSDWVEVRFRNMADVEFAAGLVEMAVAAHRPPAGVMVKQPPAGAELARRRRFH
jgi:hypothetical protein